VWEDRPVRRIELDGIRFASGEHRPADVVFVATGVRPSPVIASSGLPTGPDGGLRVNRFLRSTADESVFGGGDCIWFEDRPLDKVGVYAVRQNPVLFHNLMAAFTGAPPTPFAPGGEYLLIYNLGDGTGIFYKHRIVFSGRLAFRIKDFIDRRFMASFQEPANRQSGRF
jgi:NADH dehydrogenase FAD-containing subunit